MVNEMSRTLDRKWEPECKNRHAFIGAVSVGVDTVYYEPKIIRPCLPSNFNA